MTRTQVLLLTLPIIAIGATALVHVETGKSLWVERVTDTVYVETKMTDTVRVTDTVRIQDVARTTQDTILYIACGNDPVRVIHYPARLDWIFYDEDEEGYRLNVRAPKDFTVFAITSRHRCTVSRSPL